MIDVIEARLADLREEHERGEAMLEELQARQATLRDTLHRIREAIQVLEEQRGARWPEDGPPVFPPGDDAP